MALLNEISFASQKDHIQKLYLIWPKHCIVERVYIPYFIGVSIVFAIPAAGMMPTIVVVLLTLAAATDKGQQLNSGWLDTLFIFLSPIIYFLFHLF